MITIYSTLKPHTPIDSWHDRFEIIQTNAVNSWKQLTDVEIVIFGNDKQTKDFCKKHDVINYTIETGWKTNLPKLNKMLEKIEILSSNNIFLFISDDTIIFKNTIEAAKILSNNLNEFCGCVQRYDAPVPNLLDFNSISIGASKSSTWDIECQNGKTLGHLAAGDYFLYSRGYWDDVPPFIVGHTHYEYWLRQYASNVKKSLVDMTENVLTIHSDHAHSHIKGNHDRVQGWLKNLKESNEFKQNVKLFSRHNNINISNYKLLEKMVVAKVTHKNVTIQARKKWW